MLYVHQTEERDRAAAEEPSEEEAAAAAAAGQGGREEYERRLAASSGVEREAAIAVAHERRPLAVSYRYMLFM